MEYSTSGWYTVKAINQILYEHVQPPVVLVSVLTILPGETYTLTDVLSNSPNGCSAYLIQYQHGTAGNWVTHYKARLKSGDTWYDCDSIAYALRQQVQIVDNDDWGSNLRPPEMGTTTLYCLVEGDAYLANQCLIRPPYNIPLIPLDDVMHLKWVDGRSLMPNGQPVRRAHNQYIHQMQVASNASHKPSRKQLKPIRWRPYRFHPHVARRILTKCLPATTEPDQKADFFTTPTMPTSTIPHASNAPDPRDVIPTHTMDLRPKNIPQTSSNKQRASDTRRACMRSPDAARSTLPRCTPTTKQTQQETQSATKQSLTKLRYDCRHTKTAHQQDNPIHTATTKPLRQMTMADYAYRGAKQTTGRATQAARNQLHALTTVKQCGPNTTTYTGVCTNSSSKHTINTHERLRIATWNVRGVQSSYTELHTIVKGLDGQRQPHILVLTELKLKNKATWLTRMLKDYHVYYSLNTASNKGQAGLVLAVLKSATELGEIRLRPMSDCMQGFMLHVTLTLPESTPLHVIGVYCPHNTIVRRRIYWIIQHLLHKQIPLAETIMVAGDFNATARKCDRTGLSCRADQLHQDFLESSGLTPMDQPQQRDVPRHFTYRKGMSNLPCSRIDDILINRTPQALAGMDITAHVQDMTGSSSDHNILRVETPFSSIHLLPPLPPEITRWQANTRLTRLTKQHKTQLMNAIEEQQGVDWSTLDEKTTAMVHSDLVLHRKHLETMPADTVHTLQKINGEDSRAVVDRLGGELLELLAASRDIALQTCPTVATNAKGMHFRPRRIARKWKRLKEDKTEVARRLQNLKRIPAEENELDTHAPPVTPSTGAPCRIHQQIQQHIAQHTHATEEQALQKIYSTISREQAEINREHKALCEQAEASRQQQVLQDRPKLGNKLVTGQHKPTPKMACRAILTDEGLVINPAEVIEAITAWGIQKTIAPTGDTKTGRYLPQQVDRQYPFDALSNHEFAAYKGLLQRTCNTQARRWAHTIIDDTLAFNDCLKTLKSGKTPGPDGVMNEVIQALPQSGKRAIHNIIKILWATGLTPSCWKASHTILLYKHKGSPLELNYYRRIGLEYTIYKVWTRMTTVVMADIAERYNILSNSQAGFRHKRSTTQQLETMVMAFEDAFLTRQDIYLLMADMTEAFDTISHDKLLMILYDLGYPTDAIEVVRDLYTGATTTIQTPYGPTPPITLERGTIQGDSLSPFLFVLYIEPLLRWLQANGKGYKLGVLKQLGEQQQAMNQISNITFADDINLLTGGKTGLLDMKHQASKLSHYLTWGHLQANNTKSLITGALHGSQSSKPYDIELLKMQLSPVKLQDKPITFHSPQEPFSHLGLLLTMDLNFTPQLAATLEEIRSMTSKLRQSYVGPRQKERIIDTCIRPAITYTLSVAPYTLPELKCIDNLLSAAYKQAYKLPNSLSTAATRQDKRLGGLGCHSIEVEYHTICVQRLTRSLNHPGPFGIISNALFDYQKHSVDVLSATHMPRILRYSMRLRQAMALYRSDLVMLKHGEVHSAVASMNKLATTLHTVLPNSDQWDTQLVQDLHLLSSVGVHHLNQMLTIDRKQVLPVQELTHITRSRYIKPKHRKAWNRVSHYLVTGDVHRASSPITTKNLTNAERYLHPDVCQVLKNIWPTAAKVPNTIIHFISNIYKWNNHKVIEARDALTIFTESLDRHPPGFNASVRRQPKLQLEGQSRTLTGWASSTDMISNANKPSKSAYLEKVLQLFDRHAHSEETIVGIECLTTNRLPAPRHGRHKRHHAPVLQARVQWKVAVHPGWLVNLMASLKYYPAECSVATPDDLRTCDVHRPCEFCGATARDGDIKDAVTCDTCHRRYHRACLPSTHNTITPEDSPGFHCSECRSHRWHLHPNLVPVELQLLKVRWHNTLEPLELVQSIGTMTAKQQLELKLAERSTAQQTAPAKRAKIIYSPPEHLCNTYHTQSQDSLYKLTVGDAIRDKLVIHTSPINPQLDISPTGQFYLTLREAELEVETPSGCQLQFKSVACVYMPNGHCRYTLPAETAAWLKRGYDHMQLTQPQVMAKLRAGSFAEEVYLLCERYTRKTADDEKAEDDAGHRDLMSLPPKMHYALQTIVGCTQERFSSPLDACWGYSNYWTSERRDQVFGASHDAYSVAWTGASTAFPNMNTAAATKATEWAIKSAASTDLPTLTVLILPSFFRDMHDLKYLQTAMQHHKYCHLLGTIPRNAMHLITPAHLPYTPLKQPKWQYHILAVGNVEGFRKHMPLQDSFWCSEFEYHVGRSYETIGPERKYIDWERDYDERDREGPSLIGTNSWELSLSNKFKKMLKDYHRPGRTPPVPNWRHTLPEEQQSQGPCGLERPDTRDCSIQLETKRVLTMMKEAQPNPPAPLYDWKTFAYTDGSVLQDKGDKTPAPGIGAAVHIPAAVDNPNLTVYIDCAYRNDPTIQSCVNTINRAELAAIQVALNPTHSQHIMLQSKDRTINIATDSLSSIYQIHRMLTRPQDMTEHRHSSLLQQIVDLIAGAQATVHLWKVKSHSGIIGNDRADKAAVAVAKGEISANQLYSNPTASNMRANCCWPYLHEEEHHTDETTGETVSKVRYTPLATIDKELRAHMHPLFKLGRANVDTVYYQAWDEMSIQIEHKYSHLFLTTPMSDIWLTRKIMQYRYGLLPTYKYLNRIKKAPHNICPLCGQPDGGHHAVSACSALSKSVTLRHNDAGTAIVAAVASGTKGGLLIMSDVGISKRLPHAKLPQGMHTSRLLHDHPLPATMPKQAQAVLRSSRSIPDMILYQYHYRSDNREYTIVEIKYCRDTDPGDQLARAATQHENLAQSLESADPTAAINRINLVLGVSGTMYKSLISDLEELGVTGAPLKHLLKSLHCISVTHLGKIWKHRQALIAVQNQNETVDQPLKTHTYRQPQHRTHTRRKTCLN